MFASGVHVVEIMRLTKHWVAATVAVSTAQGCADNQAGGKPRSVTLRGPGQLTAEDRGLVRDVGGLAPNVVPIETVVDNGLGRADETGLKATDIEMVMSQVRCTRGEAVAALRAANGEIVDAIIQLSS
jgi:NACalpha-BTF3-like transcription factor